MRITYQKTVNALLTARRVLASPSVFGGQSHLIPISVESIQDFVTKESGYTVKKEAVLFDGQHLLGRIEKYNDKSAIIQIRANLDKYWKRVVAVKELLHLILDEDDDQCPYGDQIIDELCVEGLIGILSPNGDLHQSELIAEIAAMEVLYPMALRVADVRALAAGNLTFGKIALKYEMPDGMISSILNKKYMSLITKALVEVAENLSEPTSR